LQVLCPCVSCHCHGDASAPEEKTNRSKNRYTIHTERYLISKIPKAYT
jgi:hypothetical protein